MYCIVERDAIQRPYELEKFKVQTEMDPNVTILRIFPGITPATVSIIQLVLHVLFAVTVF